MSKLIKGSKKAKEFMAKIRAKKKKVSGVKESTKLKKELAKKKIRLPHGYTTVKRVRKISGLHKDTKSHNVKISVVSGVEPYIKNINNGLIQLQKEVNFINEQIKITKDSFLKKSLLNRKKYLNSEILIGKRLLKKFK